MYIVNRWLTVTNQELKMNNSPIHGLAQTEDGQLHAINHVGGDRQGFLYFTNDSLDGEALSIPGYKVVEYYTAITVKEITDGKVTDRFDHPGVALGAAYSRVEVKVEKVTLHGTDEYIVYAIPREGAYLFGIATK